MKQNNYRSPARWVAKDGCWSFLHVSLWFGWRFELWNFFFGVPRFFPKNKLRGVTPRVYHDGKRTIGGWVGASFIFICTLLGLYASRNNKRRKAGKRLSTIQRSERYSWYNKTKLYYLPPTRPNKTDHRYIVFVPTIITLFPFRHLRFQAGTTDHHFTNAWRTQRSKHRKSSTFLIHLRNVEPILLILLTWQGLICWNVFWYMGSPPNHACLWRYRFVNMSIA